MNTTAQFDYLTIRSGYNGFSELLLNGDPIQEGVNSYFGLAAFINAQNASTKKYVAKKLFSKTYKLFAPDMLANMSNDLQNEIITPAKTAGRVPVVVVWSNHMGGGTWDSSPDFTAFLKKIGAGPKLADINQKVTQLGSGDMLGIGYILVAKYDGEKHYEVFETSDINHQPSASLSLQMAQVPVELTDGTKNSFIALRDDLT